jgi:streptogramin lyase
MRFNAARCLFRAFLIAALASPATAVAGDVLLSGMVKSSAGEKMGGVAVSAKAEGGTITTTVFTDQAGSYYFPPLPAGAYRVRAQALSYETTKVEVNLASAGRQDFTLQPILDPERRFRQLPGDEMLAALPGATAEEARMKTLVRKNCTGCHTASYPLQHKFDAAGWSAILDLMKHVNVLGTYQGPNHKANATIEFHKVELADYLARARGPGGSSMKVATRPRPSGEPARAVFTEYDVPMEPGHSSSSGPSHDGSDWSLGTPSGMNGLYGVHDAQADLDGNLWFTYSHASHAITVGRIDAKTGAVKFFKLDDVRGFVAGSHGMTRDENGTLWFNTRSNVQRTHGGLGRIDPKTEKITIYVPPQPMSGTAGTLDVDLRGNVWVTSPDGALRFNTATEAFTEFKSGTYQTPGGGRATVYGLAVDRDGNGWWVLMSYDLIDKGDAQSGKTTEFRLPPVAAEVENLTPEQRELYTNFTPPDFNTPFPWAHGPRRLGADKNGEFVWVGNSFSGTLAKIEARTLNTTLVPLPNPESQQPYQIAVDKDHNVWTNLWSTDVVAKYDPSTATWTLFDLPTRGTESRYISLLERMDGLQVVIPYSRARKVAVMRVRSGADLEALKKQADAK